MCIDGRAFHLVNDVNEPPTGLTPACENELPKHLCLGLLLCTGASIHTEQVRMLPFHGRICYWQNIWLLLLYTAMTEITQTRKMRLDGCAFHLGNDLDAQRTDLRCARQITFQNTCVWVSFSSPARAYTQNKLGCYIFTAEVADGKIFGYYYHCCTPP